MEFFISFPRSAFDGIELIVSCLRPPGDGSESSEIVGHQKTAESKSSQVFKFETSYLHDKWAISASNDDGPEKVCAVEPALAVDRKIKSIFRFNTKFLNESDVYWRVPLVYQNFWFRWKLKMETEAAPSRAQFNLPNSKDFVVQFLLLSTAAVCMDGGTVPTHKSWF